MAACSNSSTSSATLPVIGTGARLARGPSSSRSSDLAGRAGDTTDVADSLTAAVRLEAGMRAGDTTDVCCIAALVASKSWTTQSVDMARAEPRIAISNFLGRVKTDGRLGHAQQNCIHNPRL